MEVADQEHGVSASRDTGQLPTFTLLVSAAAALFGIAGYALVTTDTTHPTTIALACVLLSLAAWVGRRMAQSATLTRQEARLTDISSTDPLTGLANRNMLCQQLVNITQAAKASQGSFALLLMDLDRFKEINNTLGHRSGDEFLQHVAARLKDSASNVDACARLGDDEFAILIMGADTHSALAAARKLQSSLEVPVILDGIEIIIRISIGVALFPNHGDDADALFRHAEIAMYHAKRHGLGLTTYNADIDPYSIRRLALLSDLRHAIDNNQMLLHFQPKIDLSTNRTTGVEALTRWKHPQHGMVSPMEFITLAEQSEVIRTLTYWVLDEALLQCHTWLQKGYVLNIAINLSARNLHDPGLPVKVAGLLAKWRVPPSLLTLEITENAIMIDPERAMKILTRLDSMGVKLSIDDFGTGYSSLVYLRKIPVTQIKVDRSFVINMTKDEDDAIIVQSTIDLGHNMNCQVVAEGVEDKEILDRLRKLGCDHVQGYFISRPLPANDITAWFAQSQWGLGTPAFAGHLTATGNGLD